MKKILLAFIFILSVVFTTHASGISAAYDNKIVNQSVDESTKKYFENATQLAMLRIDLEKSIAKIPKLAFAQKISLKTVLNKVKQAEKKAYSYSRFVMIVGILFMLIGLFAIILAALNNYTGNQFNLFKLGEKVGLNIATGSIVFLFGFGIWFLGKFAVKN